MNPRVLYRTRDGVVRVDFGRSSAQPTVDEQAQQLAARLEESARRHDEADALFREVMFALACAGLFLLALALFGGPG